MKAKKPPLPAILAAMAFGLSLALAACAPGASSEASPSPAQERGPVSSPGVNTPMPAPALTSAPAPTATAPPEARPTSSTSSTVREIKVTLKNNAFPKELRVKVGEKVVFVVTNEGTVKHTFEFPDFDEMRYKEIQKGDTVWIEWVVPNKKGKWDMGCFLTEEGFHERMEGTLIIE